MRDISKKTAWLLILIILFPSHIFAQSLMPYMPPVGTLVLPTEKYDLPTLKGIRFDKDSPLNFTFFFNKSDLPLTEAVLKEQALKTGRYFLAALTIPEEDLWVNLSPYESKRIIPNALGQTDLGKDMLGEDYVLKQLAASLTHPDTPAGRAYWHDLRNLKSQISNLRSNEQSEFQKVWIVPDKIRIYESPDKVVIDYAKLKVLCEADYKSQISNFRSAQNADAFKRHILPLIEKEVNEGKQFAHLRQLYSAIILGLWFKDKLKDTVLAQAYFGKDKIKGVDASDPQIGKKIYEEYVRSFNAGVYKMVKSERTLNKVAKRTYFSGGAALTGEQVRSQAHSIEVSNEDPAMQMDDYAQSVMHARPVEPVSGSQEELALVPAVPLSSERRGELFSHIEKLRHYVRQREYRRRYQRQLRELLLRPDAQARSAAMTEILKEMGDYGLSRSFVSAFFDVYYQDSFLKSGGGARSLYEFYARQESGNYASDAQKNFWQAASVLNFTYAQVKNGLWPQQKIGDLVKALGTLPDIERNAAAVALCRVMVDLYSADCPALYRNFFISMAWDSAQSIVSDVLKDTMLAFVQEILNKRQYVDEKLLAQIDKAGQEAKLRVKRREMAHELDVMVKPQGGVASKARLPLRPMGLFKPDNRDGIFIPDSSLPWHPWLSPFLKQRDTVEYQEAGRALKARVLGVRPFKEAFPVIAAVYAAQPVTGDGLSSEDIILAQARYEENKPCDAIERRLFDALDKIDINPQMLLFNGTWRADIFDPLLELFGLMPESSERAAGLQALAYVGSIVFNSASDATHRQYGLSLMEKALWRVNDWQVRYRIIYEALGMADLPGQRKKIEKIKAEFDAAYPGIKERLYSPQALNFHFAYRMLDWAVKHSSLDERIIDYFIRGDIDTCLSFLRRAKIDAKERLDLEEELKQCRRDKDDNAEVYFPVRGFEYSLIHALAREDIDKVVLLLRDAPVAEMLPAIKHNLFDFMLYVMRMDEDAFLSWRLINLDKQLADEFEEYTENEFQTIIDNAYAMLDIKPDSFSPMQGDALWQAHLLQNSDGSGDCGLPDNDGEFHHGSYEWIVLTQKRLVLLLGSDIISGDGEFTVRNARDILREKGITVLDEIPDIYSEGFYRAVCGLIVPDALFTQSQIDRLFWTGVAGHRTMSKKTSPIPEKVKKAIPDILRRGRYFTMRRQYKERMRLLLDDKISSGSIDRLADEIILGKDARRLPLNTWFDVLYHEFAVVDFHQEDFLREFYQRQEKMAYADSSEAELWLAVNKLDFSLSDIERHRFDSNVYDDLLCAVIRLPAGFKRDIAALALSNMMINICRFGCSEDYLQEFMEVGFSAIELVSSENIRDDIYSFALAVISENIDAYEDEFVERVDLQLAEVEKRRNKTTLQVRPKDGLSAFKPDRMLTPGELKEIASRDGEVLRLLTEEMLSEQAGWEKDFADQVQKIAAYKMPLDKSLFPANAVYIHFELRFPASIPELEQFRAETSRVRRTIVKINELITKAKQLVNGESRRLLLKAQGALKRFFKKTVTVEKQAIRFSIPARSWDIAQQQAWRKDILSAADQVVAKGIEDGIFKRSDVTGERKKVYAYAVAIIAIIRHLSARDAIKQVTPWQLEEVYQAHLMGEGDIIQDASGRVMYTTYDQYVIEAKKKRLYQAGFNAREVIMFLGYGVAGNKSEGGKGDEKMYGGLNFAGASKRDVHVVNGGVRFSIEDVTGVLKSPYFSGLMADVESVKL